jgi:hypothetical protein
MWEVFAMRRIRPALITLLLAGCGDVPGTSAGGPCNAKGICGKDLVCEEGICVAPENASWEKMKTPLNLTLSAVWGESAQELFAVGVNGTILRFRGDGLDWTDETANKDPPSGCNFNDVWGRSAISAWAVGAGCVYHFDGSVWKKEAVPDPVNTGKQLSSYTLNGVVGSPGGGLWATGSSTDELVLKYDEKGSWLVQAAGLTYSGEDLAVIGKQVVVVGNAQHVRMYDGAGWGSKNLDGMTALRAVFGTAADQILAVGPSGMILRFDGSSWSTDPSARLKYPAYAIAGVSLEDYYVVGQGGGYSEEFRAIEHCTPRCAPMPVPLESKEVHGVWTSADGKTVVVVGESGIIFRRRRP